MITTEEIRLLPKIELHEHLDGSLRVSSLIHLAHKAGINLPSQKPEELKKLISGDRKSLEEYLQAFQWTVGAMQSVEALEKVAYETVEDWKNDGLIYGEVRFAPELHTRRGLSLYRIIEAVLRGLDKAKEQFGIQAGLILCAMRQEKNSLEIAELACHYRPYGVVGFDIAGPEASFSPDLHLPAFHYAALKGLPTTCHAGEVTSPEYIRQAVLQARALRVGHGTQLFQEFPEKGLLAVDSLSRFIYDRRIPLEVCLTSNVQTGAVSSYAEHPFREYWKRGFAVCLCTDNRLMSATTLSHELSLASQIFALSKSDLLNLQKQALLSAFCSLDHKIELAQKHFPELLSVLKLPNSA